MNRNGTKLGRSAFSVTTRAVPGLLTKSDRIYNKLKYAAVADPWDVHKQFYGQFNTDAIFVVTFWKRNAFILSKPKSGTFPEQHGL